MNNLKPKSKPEDAEQPSGEGLSSSALLALEGAYDRFKECEKRAVWGGSHEVESAAAQDLRGLGREMFAALCQRCHLKIQGRVKMEQGFMEQIIPVSEWFRPHLEGYLEHVKKNQTK